MKLITTSALAGLFVITAFQNCTPPNPEASVPRVSRYSGIPVDLNSTTPALPTGTGATNPSPAFPTATPLPGSNANGGTPTIPTGNGGATVPANPALAQALATVRCEPDAVIRALQGLPAGTMINNQNSQQVANDIEEACDTIWWLENDALPQVVAQCNASGGLPIPNCSCQQLFTQCLE